MSKATFNFQDVPNEVLLKELLYRMSKTDNQEGDKTIYSSGFSECPKKIEFVEKYFEVIVGIGKDNHANIYFTQEDIDALNDFLEIKETE